VLGIALLWIVAESGNISSDPSLTNHLQRLSWLAFSTMACLGVTGEE
jgi:hypothetical protein